MITLTRITDVSSPLFEQLLTLYRDAFPPHERRAADQLSEKITTRPDMFFNAIYSHGELAGLLVYWNLGDFHYLEHLAVFATMRNRQIGRQVLDWISENLAGLRLLEAEPEGDEISTRRIGFYKRNGYKVLEKDYMQLSYVDGSDACRLWVMGSDEPQDLGRCIEQIRSVVYGVDHAYGAPQGVTDSEVEQAVSKVNPAVDSMESRG